MFLQNFTRKKIYLFITYVTLKTIKMNNMYKKTKLIFLCLILVNLVSAQCTMDTTTTFTFEIGANIKIPTNRDIRTYNDKQKLIKRISQIWENENWLNERYSTNEYDNRENETQVFGYEWSSIQNDWKLTYSRKKTYNTTDQLMDDLTQRLSPTTNELINESKSMYEYFDQNSIKMILSQKWSTTTNEWINVSQSNSEKIDNKTTSISQIWENQTNSWVNKKTTEKTVDENGNTLEITTQDWDKSSSTWLKINKLNYQYNDKNKISEYTKQIGDQNTNSWVNENKYYKIYNENELEKEFSIKEWDKSKNDWINLSKYEYSYNSKNKITEDLFQVWNSEKNEYYNSKKTTNEYDTDFHQISSHIYTWNQNGESLSFKGRTIFEYDNDFNLITRTIFNSNLDTDEWKEYAKNTYEYTETGEGWAKDVYLDIQNNIYQFHSREEVLCASLSSVTPSFDAQKINIFPNPIFGDFVEISASENTSYKLIDIHGRVLNAGNINAGQNSIKVDYFHPNGLYFLNISNVNYKIMICR